MDFPITLLIPTLRPKDATQRGIASELVDNMGGSVDSGLLPSGSIDFEPTGNQVGNVTLDSQPTSDHQQSLQNKQGVIALLDDVYGIRDTVILPEGLVSVDWDSGKSFLCVLSGNRQSTFYMFHSKAGMEITLLLVNNGTAQTVHAWDAAIKWAGGTAPAMPAATPGGGAIMKVNLVNVNQVIYGEGVNYSGPPVL